MKTKFCIGIILLAASLSPAQTTNLTALLQQGLFEEQASRNLDAAITDYQTLAAQFDKDRQLAATAVFRLGECYRAQGRTNEAAAQYRRILRDFSDQTTLATLSTQDLTGMGMARAADASAPTPASAPAAATENADTQLLKKLEGKSQDDLEKLMPTLMPNATLDALLKERGEVSIQRTKLLVDYAPDNVQVVRLDKQLEAQNRQIADTIAGMMQALKLRAEISPPSPKRAELMQLSVPVTSEEDQEITRIQQMIQNSPDLINTPGEGGNTPLQSAAVMGRLKVVNYLLDHGATINAGGIPALSRAAEAGNRAMVELLLSRGAQVDTVDGNGLTALHRAAARGYLSVVEALLAAKPDVNAVTTSYHRTPLTMAVEARAVFVAATLLAHGADPNNICGSPYGNPDRKDDGTPLHIAVTLNDAAMVTLLLTNHPDLTLRNHLGESALDIAATLGEAGIAGQLVAAGADVNAVSPDNFGSQVPLHRAASSASRAVVALLLEHGANPNLRSKNGATPLMLAILSNGGESARDIISVLLQHKADPNLADSEGKTPLIAAIDRHDVPEAKALLVGGANPNIRRKDGYPPLVLAVAPNNADKDMLAALISAKADVNAADPEGKTPLHWVADNNRPDLAELLIKAGADVNARARNGATPLNYAGGSNASGRRTISLPGGQLSSQWYLSVDGSGTTNAPTVADILHQHGALDELPDFTRIRITRQGLSSPVEVFRTGSRLTNQFTVLETVMRFYSRSQVLNGQAPWTALPFPDFARLTIHRPALKIGSKEQEIKVNLLNRSNIVDCAQDVPVQFGDVIEIPESVHALNASMPNPVGELEWALSSPQMRPFAARINMIGSGQLDIGRASVNAYQDCAACLQKSVQLVVGGETTTFKVDSWKEGFLKQALGRTEARAALRSSSDLSRVQVTRHTGKSAKPVVFTVDVTDNSQDEPLWLQAGDVIEVPDKP